MPRALGRRAAMVQVLQEMERAGGKFRPGMGVGSVLPGTYTPIRITEAEEDTGPMSGAPRIGYVRVKDIPGEGVVPYHD